ncbi:legume-like lectin family-domain-containing protein [Spinellus fusiger]|nr:legume-like lectin family-domain-containing protein [Spinellus fusiger]
MKWPFLIAVSILALEFVVAGGSSSTTTSTGRLTRYDYKYAIKEPYYHNDTVPFWTVGGGVIFAKNFIRLNPSVPNTKGWLWSDLPNTNKEWEATLTFRVTGSSMHGGKGLAFWYTKDKAEPGPIFGMKDRWDGLSVWLNSANPKTHTPTTLAMLNDGTLALATKADPTEHMLGSCTMDYRNTYSPVYLRVVYVDTTLTVYMDTTGDGTDYRACVQTTGIRLPTGYYFGISAASHLPADDHDLLSFQVKEINPPAKTQHPKRPLEESVINEGHEFKEIDDEQRKRIKQAEFHIQQMREAAEGEEIKTETATTLATIYDTQRRALENLLILQMQVEALGAPSPELLLQGKVAPVNNEKSTQAIEDMARTQKNLHSESQKTASRVDKVALDQERQFKEALDSIARLERTLQGLERKLSMQSTHLQSKMSEITRESADTKGTLSSFLSYVFYALIGQGILAVAVYGYWKWRVEKNEKKFL